MADLSQRYLLGTNSATDLAIGKFQSVRDRYSALQGVAHFAVSAVTEGELQYGLARKPDAVQLRRNVQTLLTKVSILPWTSAVALAYGELRARLEASGNILSPLDLMIAGHAYALGATLVTHDAALKRLTKYIVTEDWVEEEQER